MRPEEAKGHPRKEGAEGAGRPARQAAATAAGDEMGRMGEKKFPAQGGFFCFRQSARIRDDRMKLPVHPDRTP